MADNKNKKEIDGTKISSQPHEIKYWTNKWDITPQQLNGAKQATGSTSVKKIEAYLKEKGKI
jgi:Protein of unknown function (DUF3606)